MPKPFQPINVQLFDDSRPEWNLIAALLRQCVADATSVDPARREDVQR
jgi:hypothetical protein